MPSGPARLSIRIGYARRRRVPWKKVRAPEPRASSLWASLLVIGPILAAVVAGAPASSEERPPGPTIEWSGPPECTADAFSAELSRYFDAQTPIPPGTITVTVSDGARGLTLELRVEHAGRTSERTFEDPTCQAVLEAGAFVAAIALDPEAMDRGRSEVVSEPTEAVPEPEVAQPEPAPEEPVVPPPEVPTPPRRPWGWVAVAGGVAGVALPAVGGVVRADIGVRGRAWKVGVAVAYRSPRSSQASLFPNASARLSHWAMGARGCFEPGVERWAFPLCGGAEAGLVHAVGRGLSTSRNVQLPWVAIVPGAGARFEVTPTWSIVARFEPAVVVLRHRFVVESGGEVWRLRSASLRGLFGVEAAFGRR